MRDLRLTKDDGDTSDICRVMLAQLPETGDVAPLSEKPDVDAALQAGEAAFGKGEWKQANADYKRAWNPDHS